MSKFEEHLGWMLTTYLERQPGDIEAVQSDGLIFATRNKEYTIDVQAHVDGKLVEVSLEAEDAIWITQYLDYGKDEKTIEQTTHNLFVYLGNYIDLQDGEDQKCKIT